MKFPVPYFCDSTVLFLGLLLSAVIAAEVGDEVSVEGYVMDYYCIARGTLLDRSSVETLKGPDQHSVHCLVDERSCRESPFEILLDPSEGEELYTRGYRVDDAGRESLITLARKVGSSCSTCTGGGNLSRGFRAIVNGTVDDLGSGDTPPSLRVSTVQQAANGNMSGAPSKSAMWFVILAAAFASTVW